MKRRLVVFIVMSMVVAALAGCNSSKNVADKKEDKKKKTAVHKVSAKDLRLRSKAAEQLIGELEQVRDETQSLSGIATGQALKQMVAQVESDTKEGKIKVRKLADRKLEFNNVTKDLVGVKLTYTDMSFYISKSTNKPLTKPTGAKKEIILALRQAKGRWAIAEILQIDVKPKPKSKPKSEPKHQ